MHGEQAERQLAELELESLRAEVGLERVKVRNLLAALERVMALVSWETPLPSEAEFDAVVVQAERAIAEARGVPRC
jgi:hypothetical protein